MQLQIYNTLTRKKELFVPLMEDVNYKGPKKDFVGIYSCGPTVYRDPSIGNYRATFTADLIRNTIKLLGYKVKAVMNITDVGHLVSDSDEGEDKLEKWSKREGITAREVAQKYENIFKDGMKLLNIDEFDVMPKATDNIPEQIVLIKTLEKKWYTYTVAGDGIYMDTSKVENYGELMWPNYKKRLADLNAGERVDMWGKKHPTDFALRKFSPENEQRQMERESPWGKWFPGWHIECSAMSSKYLWQQFDIHHGGADHITIHHPNEIAQSECGFDVHPRVKYWIHNEFLQVDGGKMSKSLWNVYNLIDIQNKGFSALDLRYFYFMAQYSNFQNFTRDQLEQASKWYLNFYSDIKSLLRPTRKENNYDYSKIESFDDFIKESNIDDTNFQNKPFTLKDILMDSILDNFSANKLLANLFAYKNYIFEQKLMPWVNTQELTKKYLNMVFYLDEKLLKLNILKRINNEFGDEENFEIPNDVRIFADQRVEAKKNKDYILADELRNNITAIWFQVKDTKDGYEITKA